MARRGYVNLLQPQDRRSARPGDSAAAVAARRRFLSGGFETELTRAIGDLLTLAPRDALLEVGCGEGHYLAALTARFGCEGHGVDLSVPAIEAAAARHAGLHLVVANADRSLPYADASFAVVASITARRNPAEFHRVLRDDGRLLLVIPGPDDCQLREAVLGAGSCGIGWSRRWPRSRPLHPRAPRAAPARGAPRRRGDPRCDDRLLPGGAGEPARPSGRARPLAVTLSRDALVFRPDQALSWSRIGRRRIRLPVAAKIALHSAGGIGGTPGSPTPPSGMS